MDVETVALGVYQNKCFEKFFKFHTAATVSKSLFDKFAISQPAILLEKEYDTGASFKFLGTTTF